MRCPNCNQTIVPPSGPEDAPLLLFGDSPGYYEYRNGRPWVGPAGNVLERELARVGIQMSGVRLTNLWLHEPDKEEFDWHFRELMREIKHPARKAVLVMGADASRVFFEAPVGDVSGLEMDSSYIPDGVRSMACYNPAIVLNPNSTLGELRLAMERFGEMVRDV